MLKDGVTPIANRDKAVFKANPISHPFQTGSAADLRNFPTLGAIRIMARQPSAILSKADLKAAIVTAKAQLKAAKNAAKVHAKEVKEATSAFDKQTAGLAKAVTAAQKAMDKLVPPAAV